MSAPRYIQFRGATYRLAATISDEEHIMLDKLVQMAAEGSDHPNWKSTRADQGVINEYTKFRAATETALAEYAQLKDLLKPEYSASNLTDDEGMYLILMTLNGEGVGIWDGRWDHYFVDSKNITDVEEYLRSKLTGFLDVTGGGTLNEAIMEAAEGIE